MKTGKGWSHSIDSPASKLTHGAMQYRDSGKVQDFNEANIAKGLLGQTAHKGGIHPIGSGKLCRRHCSRKVGIAHFYSSLISDSAFPTS
jgi:hypothetical protein